MAEPDKLGNSAPAEAGAAEKPIALSCLTLPSFSEACGFIDSQYSCLVVKTHRRHIALPPKHLKKKRTGIKEHLDAELLKYSVVLEGVPVAYDNLKLIGELGDIFDDNGYIHLNIEADFVIFQPECGQWLVGVVNKKAPSHIGCLVHGCFNASIPRPMKMPVEAWQHVEVNIGDKLEFEVSRLDSDAVGVFCIRGRMDKRLETEAVEKLNAISEEQNSNVLNAEVQNSTETPEEGAAAKTGILSSKKKSKKRMFDESQEDTDLVEAPKKKRKKQEALSLNFSVEVDGSGDNSAIETSLTHEDSLQITDIGGAGDRSITELDNISEVPSSQKRKTKKSKKKEQKDHPDLDSSIHNGIAEDSLITEDSISEGLETESGTTKKKSKKRHKNASFSLDQDATNGIVSTSSIEAPTDDSIVLQETPKMKKNKKKHRDPAELDCENSPFQTKDGMEDSNTPSARSQDASEQKVKKKKRRKESL